jgi:hypothetical protein
LTDEDGLIAHLSREAADDEVREAKELLTDAFGSKEHSAALPLVKTRPDVTGIPAVPDVIARSIVRINEEDAGQALRSHYDVVRTPLDRFNQADADLSELRCLCMDGLDAVSAGLVAQIAISQGCWAILSWGNDPDQETVLQIVRWLKRQPVWLAPVIRIATHLRESKPTPPTFHSL